VATDQRDLAIGRDPVSRAQLADEPQLVTGPGPFAMRQEYIAAGLDRPAAGIQGSKRQTLLSGRQIQWMGSGVT
jgi:hypothetical protein